MPKYSCISSALEFALCRHERELISLHRYRPRLRLLFSTHLHLRSFLSVIVPALFVANSRVCLWPAAILEVNGLTYLKVKNYLPLHFCSCSSMMSDYEAEPQQVYSFKYCFHSKSTQRSLHTITLFCHSPPAPNKRWLQSVVRTVCSQILPSKTPLYQLQRRSLPQKRSNKSCAI